MCNTSDKKEELMEFVNSCLMYGLETNRFNYVVFRFVKGYYIRDFFKWCYKKYVNLTYTITEIKAYKEL